MALELARDPATPPGPNLAMELAAAGITTGIGWRPSGSVILMDIPDGDPSVRAVAERVLAAHVPGPGEPLPPTLEERVAALEAWRATHPNGV